MQASARIKARYWPCLWVKHSVGIAADKHFPSVGKIVLVHENLNTRNPARLSKAFPTQEAPRRVERLDSHYAAKPGSRLDLAEFELSVIAADRLDRRTADRHIIERSPSLDHR